MIGGFFVFKQKVIKIIKKVCMRVRMKAGVNEYAKM
jgi:hypothetical protein